MFGVGLFNPLLHEVVVFAPFEPGGAASHRWAAKLSLYQEPVAVPFFVTQFGKTRENITDCEHLVSGLDVLPTMLDYAGIAIPAACQGRRVRPLVEGRAADWRDFVVTELAVDPKKPERQGRMVRTAQYKYNVFSCGARNEQFFDLNADPGEMNNLISRPEMAVEVQRHRKLLKQWMEKTSDPFEVKA